VAAAGSNSNSEPPQTSIGSPGPSTSTSKEDTHPSSPEVIRLLPKAGPRKSKIVNEKKKTTAIFTDTHIKNVLKKKNYNARLGTNEKNWTQEKEEREACATFLVTDTQKKH
jgi:hypothetical protein